MSTIEHSMEYFNNSIMNSLHTFFTFLLLSLLASCSQSRKSNPIPDTQKEIKAAEQPIEPSSNNTEEVNIEEPTIKALDSEKKVNNSKESKVIEPPKKVRKKEVKQILKKKETSAVQRIDNNSKQVTSIKKEVIDSEENNNNIPKKIEEKTIKETVFTHQQFDAFLKAYVSPTGIVNYKGMKSNESKLDDYITTLNSNPLQQHWSRNKKLAYWINVYNAFTIKLILDNYPVKSITNIANGKPWDNKWIKLNGNTYSLNQIENEIIRPQFNEPRIHFAVNCAANSCPKIGNFAYGANTLNRLLEKQTKRFINGKENTISPSEIKVSKIFEWYSKDFGDLISFLNKYSNTSISKDASVSFAEYDWALNE